MDILDWFKAVIKMFMINLSLDKITVSTKNLIFTLGNIRIVPNKLVTVINVSNSFFTVSSMDMIHLQSTFIRKSTVDTLIAKYTKYIFSLLVSYFSTMVSHLWSFTIRQSVYTGSLLDFWSLIVRFHVVRSISLVHRY